MFGFPKPKDSQDLPGKLVAHRNRIGEAAVRSALKSNPCNARRNVLNVSATATGKKLRNGPRRVRLPPHCRHRLPRPGY